MPGFCHSVKENLVKSRPFMQSKLQQPKPWPMMQSFGIRPDTFGQVTTADGGRLLASKHGDPVGNFKKLPRVRFDGYNHLPEQMASKDQICTMENCKRRTTYWCTKC